MTDAPIPDPALPLSPDQMLHSQKLQALGQLAGGVAHDFNNILSIIEGYTRMLERQLGPGDPRHTEKLQHILEATKRGAGLTRRLLAFGRQNILPDAHCDLVQAVRDNEVLLRPLLTSSVALHIHTPDMPLFVSCDGDIISQILINLATNARDALPPQQGEVWINVTATPHEACLALADNGCGIPADYMTKIFDPFFTTKPQGKGTGLGLSMISGLVQQLGGQVKVDSRLNHGTTFTITLPRKQIMPGYGSNDTHPNASLTEFAKALAQKTILIVDDEEAILPFLEEQLQGMGMKVLKAANAERALVLQHDYTGPIDLLLTDIVMPGMNGIRLADLIRSERPQTGIVFMTGYPRRGADMLGSSPLPDNALVLPKPLPLDTLSPTLLKALEAINKRQGSDAP